MEKTLTTNTNILPNNPMKTHGLLDTINKLRGKEKWLLFNLRCLVAAFPKEKAFADAYKLAEKGGTAIPDVMPRLVKVKGDTGWYDFNLKVYVAAYPKEATFAKALTELQGKDAGSTAKAADKVNPAPSATTAKAAATPAPTTKGNTKGRKTAAQLQAEKAKKQSDAVEAPGESTLEEDAAELADIK